MKKSSTVAHYDQAYFNYQKGHGAFAAEAMHHFFSPYLTGNDNLLDFGCGGGFLLHRLKAKQKLGIEINPSARAYAGTLGVSTVEDIPSVPDHWADVLVSNHALEHTLRPFDILVALRDKVKSGGKIIFIVPHETKVRFNKDDINKHLYTWSEMCIGNLFTETGYQVLESKELVHRFPPYHKKIVELFGWRAFHQAARIWGWWARYRYMTQIRVVATVIH